MTKTSLSGLSEKLLNDSSYKLAYEIARDSPVLVPELLRDCSDIIHKIQDDYVFGSCLLFANKPTYYQIPFFRVLEKQQDATILWPRQSGKTHSLGIGCNLVALTRKNVRVLAISASMRQSKILRNKMNAPLLNMHKKLQYLLYDQILKTRIVTRTGSSIGFESCLSEDKLRGDSIHVGILDELTVWPNAEYTYSEIIDPMFNTTDGCAVAAFTPKTTHDLAYKLTQDAGFVHLHATWLDAIKAGIMSPLRANKINQKALDGKISKAGMLTEYWARFYDDEAKLLQYNAIINCISADENYQYYATPANMVEQSGFKQIVGNFFIGCDLGQIGDNCVIVLIEKINDHLFAVRHIKVFALNTPYKEYIAYADILNTAFTVKGGYIDGTNNAYLAEQIGNCVRGKVIKMTTPFRKETARIIEEKVNMREIVLPQDKLKFYEALNSINRDTLDTDNQTQHSGNSDQFWACSTGLRAAIETKHGIIAKGRSL